MDIKDKLWEEELKRLNEAPTDLGRSDFFWPLTILITITALTLIPTILLYSYDNHMLKAEIRQMKTDQFNPAPVMQPIRFSPYYIIKPEDNCPTLDLVELGGIRSCQKSV